MSDRGEKIYNKILKEVIYRYLERIQHIRRNCLRLVNYFLKIGLLVSTHPTKYTN